MLLSNREAASVRLNCESHGVGFIPEMLLRTIIAVPWAGVNEKLRSKLGNMNCELGIRNLECHPPALSAVGAPYMAPVVIPGGRNEQGRDISRPYRLPTLLS